MKHYYSFLILLMLGGHAYAQLPTYVPSNGLVAWWGFNGDYLDQSGNANHLASGTVAPNAVTDRLGTAGGALEFDGVSTYLSKSSLTSQFSQAGSFSVSIWMKKNNYTGGVAIMSGNATNNNFIWLIQTNTLAGVFGTNKQSSSWIWVNGPEYEVNQWDHYIGVYSSGLMTFYKNGLVEGTNTNAYTANTASLPIWLGRGFGGGYISADLDDVGIWNRALTSVEVTQLYESTLETTGFVSNTTSVFPNPFSDSVNFTFTSDKLGKDFAIYDELGRNVYFDTIETENTSLNLSNLSKGMYFLKILTESKAYKFIKN